MLVAVVVVGGGDCCCRRCSAPDIRRALVDLPAAVQQKDSNGWQPLFWAVLNNSEEAVRLLIE